MTHASHTTDITTDPTTLSVTPGHSFPWYDQDATLGSFIYHYPITLPPGRGAISPELSLEYNSASVQETNLVGAGWSLSIPHIERMNKTGVEDLYDSTTFRSTLSGELLPLSLTDTTHGTYGAEVETGAFSTYEYDLSTESWTQTDAQGTTYTFGDSVSSRVDDPNDGSRVFTWYVSEIRDVNDNFISFTYIEDENQLYPSSITYTGNGSTAGSFVVTFTLESRADTTTSFASGFEVTTDQRVSMVTITVDGTTRHAYSLGYTTGDNGTRSLLSAVTQTAYDQDGNATILDHTQIGGGHP